MNHFSYHGSPNEIGSQYGKELAPLIHGNLRILIDREGCDRTLPRQDNGFISWVLRNESMIEKHWPWLLEEMNGLAREIGVDYEDILLLNLRAWQYEYYGGKPVQSACTSIAITLADGTVLCAGALDDQAKLYCGPVKYAPEFGHSFITFPITGTSWGNRGMNSGGLSVGISSQILPGLIPADNTVQQDLAMRALLQTCADVNEVREFCREHPFTLNLVCVDVHGGIFCAQNTMQGLTELPVDGYCVLTNHICDDELIYRLRQFGVSEFPESPSSRPRRGKLLSFAREHNGKCTLAEVIETIDKRDDQDLGSIHNSATFCITYSQPQVEKNTFWVKQPLHPEDGSNFTALTV